MKYCPKCGTANRDGSSFCSQCGEPLGSQEQAICPQCGTPNPVQNVRCTECDGRLPALPDSEETPGGPALPTEADAEDYGEEGSLPSGGEMPAWLRELGATLGPEDRLESDAPEEPSEIPEWLRDLQSSMPAEIVAGIEPGEEKDEDTEAEDEPPFSPQEEETLPSAARIEEPTDRLAAPALQGDEEQPDWLAELRSAAGDRAPVETPDAPEPESEAALDWLGTAQASDMEEAAEPELPSFDSGDEDSLDWLAELIPPPSESDVKPTRPEPRADEEQAPDWLSEPEASTEEPRALPQEPPAEAETADTSDWFADLRSSDMEPSLDREAADSEFDQVPDWLAALQASTAEPAPQPEPSSIPEEPEPEAELGLPEWEDQGEERFDWTPEPQPPIAEPEPERVEPPVELEPDDTADRIPPFPSSTIEGEEEPGLAGTVPDEVELAEWLAGLRPPSGEPEPVSPALEDGVDQFDDQLGELPRGEEPDFAPSTEEEEVPEVAVPAWLAELQVESAEEPAADLEEALARMDATDWLVPAEPRIDEGELEMAEIPAWLLALKPPELREGGEPAQPLPIVKEIDQDTGLLSGLKGTLPVEMIIAQPRAVTAAPATEVSIAETPHSRLFGEILGRAQEAAPRSIVDAPTEAPSMLPRWLVYIVLIAVVSLPLLLGEPLVLRTIEPAPATADLYSGIESLEAEANVLVAFDYDPTTSGEMDVIAQALVGHLMDRGVKIIAMSLLPAGPATAQPLLESLASERSGYVDGYGQLYVNLGYLPGQAMAVRLLAASPDRAFASDFQGTLLADLPIMQGLTSAQDFDLVLELAAGQESVRWWIEQASMPYERPLGAGVSAPVAPLIQPYYETDPRQLVGLIGGVPGAVTYEALQSGQGSLDQSTVARLDSQMLGQLLLVLVLVLGNGIFLVRRGGRR